MATKTATKITKAKLIFIVQLLSSFTSNQNIDSFTTNQISGTKMS